MSVEIEPAAGGVLALPLGDSYRPEYPLAYHGRDRLSVSERVEGRTIVKTILVDGRAHLLEIDLTEADGAQPPVARVRIDHDALPPDRVEAIAARMLGLASDPVAFEALIAPRVDSDRILGSRRGLRIPLTADIWDAVCWAVIGQQINLTFAAALRRSMIELTGPLHAVSGLRAHPDPARVADLEIEDLTALRFSRSKASYLIGVARLVADGALPLDDLAKGTPADAEAALVAVRGIGTWTARYIMLRGFGFPDMAPIGDSGLAAALQRLLDLPERPDAKMQEASMQAFAPHRSLATAHLWAGLSEP
ncbi:DNA-3-methyladenine glycosylase family protein [Kaistia granuli]|uniref:DNA-3-methyladenine glycosylase family protein n=1 Tax=Kaistia granuli TaxID=363259 RepID=UPI000361E511|nr:DNA-3-methyladenine glycosylase [Kaistia granuli]